MRLGLLTAHYRQPLDWTAQLAVESQQKLDRLYGALRDAGVTGALTGEPQAAAPAAVLAALEDDLNTPVAIAELFTLARTANRTADPKERRALAESLRAGGALLGVLRNDPAEWFAAAGTGAPDDIEAAEIESLLARRKELKLARNYQEADRIRDGLATRGILIEDVAGGTRWRRAR